MIDLIVEGALKFGISYLIKKLGDAQKENEHREKELARRQLESERQIEQQTLALERSKKAKDAHLRKEFLLGFLMEAKSFERTIKKEWLERKTGLVALMEQRNQIYAKRNELKKHLAMCKKGSPRYKELIKKIRPLTQYAHHITLMIDKARLGCVKAKEAFGTYRKNTERAREALREFKNSIRYFVCKSCGRRFALKNFELDFYYQKQESEGWEMPKYCAECRAARRLRYIK